MQLRESESPCLGKNCFNCPIAFFYDSISCLAAPMTISIGEEKFNFQNLELPKSKAICRNEHSKCSERLLSRLCPGRFRATIKCHNPIHLRLLQLTFRRLLERSKTCSTAHSRRMKRAESLEQLIMTKRIELKSKTMTFYGEIIRETLSRRIISVQQPEQLS